MQMRELAVVMVSVGLAGTALAGPTIYGTKAAGTATMLHGGDRELVALAFQGTASVLGDADLTVFADGSLTNNQGTYGWSQAIPRDVNSNNNNSGNPDRADSASPFLGEAGKTGTLAEVFGNSKGYKNLSWIIDGEDSMAYTLDLYFAAGHALQVDGNAGTVELAFLERGGNSDIRVYGLAAGGGTVGSFVINRNQTTAAGWNLDTLEIGGAQAVEGVGVSLDQSWNGIVGFRFEAVNGFNGPDIVAVGAKGVTRVPTPGALALAGLGLAVGGRRRR